MARSKAWQAQQWWTEINSLTRGRCIAQFDWDEPTSQSVIARSKPVNNYPPASTQSSFAYVDMALAPTWHAQQRMAQRNLSAAEIEYVLLYGQSWHKAGAIIVYLRRKDLPSSDQLDQRWQQLIGTTVVMSTISERVVLTAYRNRRSGLRQIKRKPDYDRARGNGRGR
jgi:hypothetical protein